jgi:hypothetical protein
VPYDRTLGEWCSPGPRVLLPRLGSSHVFATRWHSVAASDLRLLFHSVRSSRLSFHGMSWKVWPGIFDTRLLRRLFHNQTNLSLSS